MAQDRDFVKILIDRVELLRDFPIANGAGGTKPSWSSLGMFRGRIERSGNIPLTKDIEGDFSGYEVNIFHEATWPGRTGDRVMDAKTKELFDVTIVNPIRDEVGKTHHLEISAKRTR
jgi:hypothetical protein